MSKFAILLNASELTPGKKAVIEDLPESQFNQRLAEMGCVPETTIELLYRAPSGDPIAFDIDGYILALRKSEAACILVKKNDSNA